MNNPGNIERKSSAITLSDMEVFIFPELIYSLVLANIMSPRIWNWLNDPWFDGLDRMSPYRRILRLKQYIMDHYIFNLDLDTWGLTTKEKELARFKDFIDKETLAQSNALFGYEGDKYYFDIDIRTHFGLDKYAGNVIPYWKTETVEAMDAFQYKPHYETGAGECVSLAALYSAALFIIARIPLKDIYLMATPLHSQNFIDINDGILTNNRRLVTKKMWFNGTALSAQARRALENERVTVLAHETGYIHTVYEKATIEAGVYDHFIKKLQNYLKIRFNEALLGDFLRQERDLQKCFQIKWAMHGIDHYIGAEKVYKYEHNSPYRFNDNTRDKLMAEIDMEEFRSVPTEKRIIINELEHFIRDNDIDMNRSEDVKLLKEKFASDCMDSQIAIESLAKFCHTKPRVPNPQTKKFISGQKPLGINIGMKRKEVIGRLEEARSDNDMADMAFYAYRDLNRTDHEPFLLAAMERNPVSIEGALELGISEIARSMDEMPDDSIYDGPGRLAQPDEVWNYRRGDGIEKALLLANILRNRMPGEKMTIELSPDMVLLKAGRSKYNFKSRKRIKKQLWAI